MYIRWTVFGWVYYKKEERLYCGWLGSDHDHDRQLDLTEENKIRRGDGQTGHAGRGSQPLFSSSPSPFFYPTNPIPRFMHVGTHVGTRNERLAHGRL